MTDRPPPAKNPVANALVERFKARTATVGVIWLGYVGLPLVCRFADAGFKTIGFDIDLVQIQPACASTTTMPSRRSAECGRK